MHPFRAAVEGRDIDAALALFAEDATIDSPVAFKPFAGIDQVSVVLRAVSETFEDFHYTDELEADGKAALIFRTHIGDRQLEGLDLFRFDAEGQIVELTVMVRPLSGVIALAEAVGPKLAPA
jgi:hypothetical protein